MASGINVFEQAIENLSGIPTDAWFVGLGACALLASGNLAFWATGERLNWAWAVPALVLVAVWFAAAYVSTVGVARRPTTLPGYVRFALTSIATVFPIVLTLALVIIGEPFLGEGARVSVLLIGLVTGLVLASLLAGWPLAQSMSADFVSPVRLLKATRGHRGSLILLGFVTGGIGNSDIVPDISKARHVGEAALIAIAEGFFALVLLAVTAAIAATAWQLAVRADPTLDPF